MNAFVKMGALACAAASLGMGLAGCGSGSASGSSTVTVAGDVPLAYVKRATSISMNPTDGTSTADGGDLMIREKSSPSAPEHNITAAITQGKDAVPVEKAVLSPDKKTLTLTLPDMQPAMTLRLKFKIQSADGKPVEQEIHSTIHRLPGVAAK